MRIIRFIVFALLLSLALPTLAIASEGGDPEVAGGTILTSLWTFLNSPLGITIVVAVLSWILGKLFTAKPAWKTYVVKYGPLLMQAVKYAEKEIKDDNPNKGLARLDSALKYVLLLKPKLDKAAVTEALTAVHAEAERDGNL